MTDTAIRPFQNEHSHMQPAVDPISGWRPSITLSEQPLRICLLSSTYPPLNYDGVARLTHLMARGLFEQGHSVHVITTAEREATSFYDGAFVHTIKHEPSRYERFKSLQRLYNALNHSHDVHERVMHLIINDGVQIVDSPLWLFEGLTTAISDVLPVVVRLVTAGAQVAALHNEASDDTRLTSEMERELIRHATHVLPNTQATLDNVCKTYHLEIAPERRTIVPYGIVPAGEESVRPFDLSRAGKPDNELTVLFVGRLGKRKGITDLFEAIPKVLAKVPHVRFVIAGADNSPHDGFAHKTGLSYPAYFAQKYAAFAPRVTFMGAVSDDELQSLYQTCDLFVAPSLYESFGLVYLEAMNYAKPVIGCRAGGIPEVVDHDVTGLLVEPEAPQQLAEALLKMLQSPDHLRSMGLEARQQVKSRFSYSKMASDFASAYHIAIARHTNAQP